MPRLASQSSTGEIRLLSGEIPGLIFTTQDRRAAYQALRQGPPVSAELLLRLTALAEEGRSCQAEHFLGELTTMQEVQIQ